MANKIQFKRGLKSKLPTLALGEPGLCTDTGEVFVGGASGNVKINAVTLSDVQTSIQNAAPVLGTYAGDNAASRTINLGFTPRAVFLRANNNTNHSTQIGYFNNERPMIGIAAANFPFTYDSSASGLSIVANGFSVTNSTHTGMNMSTIKYMYLAYR